MIGRYVPSFAQAAEPFGTNCELTQTRIDVQRSFPTIRQGAEAVEMAQLTYVVSPSGIAAQLRAEIRHGLCYAAERNYGKWDEMRSTPGSMGMRVRTRIPCPHLHIETVSASICVLQVFLQSLFSLVRIQLQSLVPCCAGFHAQCTSLLSSSPPLLCFLPPSTASFLAKLDL